MATNHTIETILNVIITREGDPMYCRLSSKTGTRAIIPGQRKT